MEVGGDMYGGSRENGEIGNRERGTGNRERGRKKTKLT